MCRALTELYEDGVQEGIKEGESRFLKLGKKLIAAGGTDELARIFTDQGYREQLYLEYDQCHMTAK